MEEKFPYMGKGRGCQCCTEREKGKKGVRKRERKRKKKRKREKGKTGTHMHTHSHTHIRNYNWKDLWSIILGLEFDHGKINNLIKRHLLLGKQTKKAMKNINSIIKSRDITLLTCTDMQVGP